MELYRQGVRNCSHGKQEEKCQSNIKIQFNEHRFTEQDVDEKKSDENA